MPGVVKSQVFQYESDDLGCIEDVLKTMLPIWFGYGKHFNCHTKLHPSVFDNGSNYGVNDYYRILETNQGTAIIKPSRIYGGVPVYEADDIQRWRSIDETSRKACQDNKNLPNKPQYMWLTSLEGPYSRAYGEEVELHRPEDALNHFLKAFRESDKDKFLSTCEGEPSWFDGSSAVGYRITHRDYTVHASYCTILYGK